MALLALITAHSTTRLDIGAYNLLVGFVRFQILVTETIDYQESLEMCISAPDLPQSSSILLSVTYKTQHGIDNHLKFLHNHMVIDDLDDTIISQ